MTGDPSGRVVMAAEVVLKAAWDWRIFGVDHNRKKNRHEQALADAVDALSKAEEDWREFTGGSP